LKIKIFYDQTKYRFKGWKKAVKVLEKVIKSEKKALGDLNFIITNDDILLKINREFLKHEYYTDVLAFGDSLNNVVNGEVYISADTVKNNANNYNVSLNNEMLRVIIHGLLHIIGYEDDNEEKKKLMHYQEDKWLMEFKRF
jgi:rRNA maturation RNase YbeY